MNKQQLAVIENRWLEASGGPWTVDGGLMEPYEKRGKRHTSAEAMARFELKARTPSDSREAHRLESHMVRNFADAVDMGVVTTHEQWVAKIDEDWPHVDWERITQNCRVIYPATVGQRKAEQVQQDKKFASDDDREVVHHLPALAILGNEQDGSCRPEDLHFILHAPEDMGTLITAVRASDEKVDDLTKALKEAKAEAVLARSQRSVAIAAVDRAKEAARRLLELT